LKKVEYESFIIKGEPFFYDLNEQLEVIWKIKPKILTFHFGLPSKIILEKAKELNIFVGCTATSIVEAKVLENSGFVDFIIAQGVESGNKLF
jgi:nitronate monooxygenase